MKLSKEERHRIVVALLAPLSVPFTLILALVVAVLFGGMRLSSQETSAFALRLLNLWPELLIGYFLMSFAFWSIFRRLAHHLASAEEMRRQRIVAEYWAKKNSNV